MIDQAGEGMGNDNFERYEGLASPNALDPLCCGLQHGRLTLFCKRLEDRSPRRHSR
jgi:hypothetical protein